MKDLEQVGSRGPNACGDSVKETNTHFLSRINGWIWNNWGSGGPNPCGDSIKKMNTHFLSLD